MNCMHPQLTKRIPVILVLILLIACTRKSTEFGTVPDNSYTGITFTDTIGIQFSTVLIDSFVTGAPASFLLGNLNDPSLGKLTAKPFFQVNIPSATPEIPASDVFDSLTLIIRHNDYYYGDTTLPLTIRVNELAEPVTVDYQDKLYNTSTVAVKPDALGTATLKVRPREDDSIQVRLSNAKGSELFEKLRSQSSQVKNIDEFLNYFYGLSLAVESSNTALVWGLNAGAGSVTMRLHYHGTNPYPEEKFIDFGSLNNNYAFNQLLTDRSGTGLVSQGNLNMTEIPASQTGNKVYEQAGMGLYLKMIFPTLRSLLTTKTIAKLLKAELVVRPYPLSFDDKKFRLPTQTSLAVTDASNIVGNDVLDAGGTNVLYADPVIDYLYGENNYYSFNITPYINQMLYTGGSEDDGFYMLHNTSTVNIDRMITGYTNVINQQSRLLLTFVVINNNNN